MTENPVAENPVTGEFGRIGLVAVTAAGRRHAAVLAAAWPGRTRLIGVGQAGPGGPGGPAASDGTPGSDGSSGSAGAALREAWSSCDAIVAFLATGAVVRLVAPLLGDKATDPGVVVVDEAARHAVALLGGHAGGANALAVDVAAVLGAEPVITTATDATGVPGLDTLGWPVEGAVAAVSRAILDGVPVHLESDRVWPLPALPANVSSDVPPDLSPGVAGPRYRIVVSDRVDGDGTPGDGTVVLRPPSLVVGVGASRGVTADEVDALIGSVLAGYRLSPASVACLATADVKADEAGIVEAARRRGVPLVTHPAAALARVDVPNPSEVVRAAVGTPSVAEAAALLGDGRAYPVDSACPVPVELVPAEMVPAELVAPKRVGSMATVAVARHAPRGRLAVVGLGPGARDLLTPRALDEIRRASVVVGLDQYVDQVRDVLRPGTRVLVSGLGEEEARAHAAVDEARAGHAVALLGSGDAGVYAMASPALEYADETVDVVGVPGVTAGLAASALLGAPLGHDHAYLSLSDLHTPWEIIERRVRAVAEGDLVALFYNPRSRVRDWQLGAALKILAERRPPETPVGVVRHASRPGQSVACATLAEFDPATVDMYSLVVVGSSRTRFVAGRMVTPRGYTWQR